MNQIGIMFFKSSTAPQTIRAALAAGILLVFASCASTSAVRKDETAINPFADLPAGALAYIRVDVSPSRTLLDRFLTRYRLNTKTVKTFFDRTDTAVAAIYPAQAESPGEDAARRFLLAGYGKNYPAALSSFSLFFSPAWKKTKSVTGKKFWRSTKNRVSLFMQKNRALISDGDPFFTGDGAETPENFRQFSAETDLSAWITTPDFLNNALMRMDIPITIPATALFIGASRHEEDWEAVFRLETPGQAQARGLVSVLTLVRNALDGGYIRDPKMAELVRLLLSEMPYLDGTALVLKCPAIPEDTLAGLIASFSIQLNEK
jgi:hypothetical protein